MKGKLAGMMGSTGDKGAVILKLSYQAATGNSSFCFVGAHLDASSEKIRASQTSRVMQSLKAIDCDSTWWAGDFNPRLANNCCPWDKLQFMMHHRMKESVVDTMKSLDPIIAGTSWRKAADSPFVLDDWACSEGTENHCREGWHELPIGFIPTFHKRYSRIGRNWPEGMCQFHDFVNKPHLDVGNAQGSNSTNALLAANAENGANIKFWEATKHGSKCPSSERDAICWDGQYTRAACERGFCWDTESSSHCPLFTDRVLFTRHGRSKERGSKAQVIGCRYESFPEVRTADHAPVVASFSVWS